MLPPAPPCVLLNITIILLNNFQYFVGIHSIKSFKKILIVWMYCTKCEGYNDEWNNLISQLTELPNKSLAKKKKAQILFSLCSSLISRPPSYCVFYLSCLLLQYICKSQNETPHYFVIASKTICWEIGIFTPEWNEIQKELSCESPPWGS